MNIVWTPDSANTRSDWYTTWGSLCTGSDTLYRHCDFTPGDTYRGICYSYGGEDPYSVFRNKVNDGFLVGSHLCHYSSFGDPTPVIAGTDCSGFVCYVWNVPRVATGTLATEYTAIQKSELSSGDILVKAGTHTVLIIEAIDSTHYLIGESTSVVNGCRERIIDITDAAWSTYVARRNEVIGSAQHNLTERQQPTSLVRVRAARGGKSISLRFSRPFRGTIEIRTTHGRSICRKAITAESGTTLYFLEQPLASGIYVATAGDKSEMAAPPVPFTVIK
jgi:hypothetical protein